MGLTLGEIYSRHKMGGVFGAPAYKPAPKSTALDVAASRSRLVSRRSDAPPLSLYSEINLRLLHIAEAEVDSAPGGVIYDIVFVENYDVVFGAVLVKIVSL